MLKVIGIRPDGTEFYCFHFVGCEMAAVIRALSDCARFGVEVYDVRAVPA